MFLSAVWTHSDGTHSLQRIHWCANDAVLNFSKSVLMIFKKFRSQDVSTFSSWGILFLQPFFKYCSNYLFYSMIFMNSDPETNLYLCPSSDQRFYMHVCFCWWSYSNQHFIRTERSLCVPVSAGLPGPWGDDRWGEQPSAPVLQTLPF